MLQSIRTFLTYTYDIDIVKISKVKAMKHLQFLPIYLKTQTLGVWPDNPSRSALVELMAKYLLQTLQRNIFAYYYD